MNEDKFYMIKRFKNHFKDFPYVWFFFFLLFSAGILAFLGCWDLAKIIVGVAVILITVLMLSKPMNAVYGLMGATGSIRIFFMLFLCITCLFACIYQMCFFQHAGISYDVNQPHINYELYKNQDRKPITINSPIQRDTVIYEKIVDSVAVREVVVKISHESLCYQPIDIWFTLRNTIMTSLMQEPTDFFAIASTFNEGVENDVSIFSKKKDYIEVELNREKSEVFQIVLILQVLISWIFFGVFISLLYNKFRYES